MISNQWVLVYHGEQVQEVIPMRKTSVDVDDRLLEQVRDVLGTASIKETIDRALREVLRAEARRREIRALAVMDGLDLADEKVMAKAWRS